MQEDNCTNWETVNRLTESHMDTFWCVFSSYTGGSSAQEAFQLHCSVNSQPHLNRHTSLLISTVAYIDHVMACVSFVLYKHQHVGIFAIKAHFLQLYARNYGGCVLGSDSQQKQVTYTQCCAWTHPVWTQVEHWSCCSAEVLVFARHFVISKSCNFI